MTGITGYDYEYLWALYLKCKGYAAKVTSKSGDEGADVIAIKDYTRIAYQCKLYSKQVGRKAIYEVHAGKDTYKCSKAIVVTNNTFTKPAIETAQKLSVGLLPNKTPERLIEACSRSYKEGTINPKDELFLQLPVAIQKAIIHGDRATSEKMNENAVRDGNGEVCEKNKIVEIPVIEKNDDMRQKHQINEIQKRNGFSSDKSYAVKNDKSMKTEKICPICGREFFEHSAMCPICKCRLADLGNKKIVKENKASNNDIKTEKKKRRKRLHFCIGIAVFIYASLLVMYSEPEESVYTEKIQVTASSKDLKGNHYADALKILQEAGFEDIDLIEDADLMFGLLKQDGEVGEVSINGKISFEKYEFFPKDAKIRITYHTFKPEFRSSEVGNDNFQEEEKEGVVEYDTLQNLFLILSYDTTMESIDSFISDNNLEFTKEEYNGTPKKYVYKIAYEPGVALQRYADSGDYVEVCFSQYDGFFLYAEYFNNSAFMDALLYNYGTHWDFRESEPNNSYSGYYYSKPGKFDGLIIEHINGSSSQTSYHPCNNAEEALLHVIVSQ